MNRKLLAAILSLALVLTVIPLTASAVSARTERVPIQNTEEHVSDTYKRFVDVPANYWGKDGISYVVDKGLFNGTGANTFSPEMPANRAMLCTVLHRFAGSPAVSGTSGYSDVKNGQWYTAGVIWAEQSGIFPSWIKKATAFEPNSSVTRGEFAVMLRNYFVWSGGSEENDCMNGVGAIFTDMPTGSRAYEMNPAIAWLYTYSILNGTGTNKMSPNDPFTRSQFAAMLERYDRQFVTGPYNPDVDETKMPSNLTEKEREEWQENRLIQLINDYRAENGLPRLNKNEKLMEAADVRVQEISQNFSHVRPDGTYLGILGAEFDAENLRADWENIVKGAFDADEAFRLWKDSKGHNNTMLTKDDDVSEIGVGYEKKRWIRSFADWSLLEVTSIVIATYQAYN